MILREGRPGTSWDLSCPDWWERLKSGRSIMPDLPLDQAEAERAAAVFDMLRVPDVIGQPTMGEAAGDWLRDVVRAVFGSLAPDGRRRVHGVFLKVPKKNNKTTGGAAIMLAALLLNERPKARFALFGPTQAIADEGFAAASGMVAADEDLARLLHVQEHIKTITHRITGAMLKVTTFALNVATGGKYAGWLLDELHLLGSVSYAKRVVAQLRGARAAIHESFGIIITTQSDVAPAGVFKEELQRARDVRDRRKPSGGILPLIYEFPEAIQTDPKKPWLDPALWPIVNPNFGRSISLDVLQELYENDRDLGESQVQIWASQHLNIQIDLAIHSDGWMGARFWMARADRTLTLGRIIAASDVLVAGIDGGGLDDLLSLVAIGRHRESRRWMAWQHSWVSKTVLEARPQIAPRLRDFADAGDLTVVGIMTDAFTQLAGRCADLFETGLLAHIGLDPAGVGLIVDALAEKGLPSDLPFLAGVSQGYQLQGAIKTAEVKLECGELVHCGQPILAWAAGNAKPEQKGNATMITKQAAGSDKIDPLMALFDAVALMSKNPQILRETTPWDEDETFRIVA